MEIWYWPILTMMGSILSEQVLRNVAGRCLASLNRCNSAGSRGSGWSGWSRGSRRSRRSRESSNVYRDIIENLCFTGINSNIVKQPEGLRRGNCRGYGGERSSSDEDGAEREHLYKWMWVGVTGIGRDTKATRDVEWGKENKRAPGLYTLQQD